MHGGNPPKVVRAATGAVRVNAVAVEGGARLLCGEGKAGRHAMSNMYLYGRHTKIWILNLQEVWGKG